MRDIRIISGKQIQPSLEIVLGLIGCGKEQTDTHRLEALFQELLAEVKMRVRPKAALTMGELSGKKVLYVMLTVGAAICRLGEKYASSDMLRMMMLDAMADSCLFAFEEQILPVIRQICNEEGYGIARRLEIPGDFSMEAQKEVYDAVEAERTLGIKITSGYMLDPVKSMCIILELTEDTNVCEMEHDCQRCGSVECKLRRKKKILLRVQKKTVGTAASLNQSEETQVECEAGSNLREVLQESGIFLSAPCGGRGTCGKCVIQVTEGALAVTPEDKNVFSEEELKQGKRLACRAVLQSNLTICLTEAEEEAFTVLGNESEKTDHVSENDRELLYGVAVDIGTTTIALSLVELETGCVIDTDTSVNHQRAFGADVIARIQSANAGDGEKLRKLIQEDILMGMKKLVTGNHISYSRVKQMVIAANTTMLHLLRGYSCEGLGSYPFAPVTLEMETCAFREIFEISEQDLPISVTLLPGISAFVGADVVAGLYEKGFWEGEKPATLLIDLGTNGEMALKTRQGIWVTSVAAGPAFEGGNIKWGMGSIPGAISKVKIRHGKAKVDTIGDAAPKGICGTGVLETVAELLREGILDETGKLAESYFYSGYPLAENAAGESIVLTQQDVREIQMAKAAIRAGIEILLKQAGISCGEVEKVYLAGGFGFYLDVEKAEVIGIFPSGLRGKIEAAGNTSLKGAIRFLTHPAEEAKFRQLKKNTQEIPVAETEEFQKLYLNYMGFERECHE